MTPNHLINQPCVITRRVQGEPSGDFNEPSWTETETQDVIHVQPASTLSGGELADRPAGEHSHTGYLRATSQIGHLDKVTLTSGQTWEVVGPARVWFNPRTQQTMYQQVDLRGFDES